MIFDYRQAGQRARIPPETIDRLWKMFRDEFPRDDMMAELHTLRAILAVERGEIALEEILNDEAA